MDYHELQHLPTTQLHELCQELQIKYDTSDKKQDIIDRIKKTHCKLKKYSQYTFIEQLGRSGKDAKTYLVENKRKEQYAMKVFKPTKSRNAIQKEIDLQIIAARAGVAPSIVDYDVDGKYIVMEKLDVNLFDLYCQQQTLTLQQQQDIIRLFQELDKCLVFHGDSNITNFMYKQDRLYMIDYGFSKPIQPKLIKRHGQQPNLSFMPFGLVLSIKSIFKVQPPTFEYLEEYCKINVGQLDGQSKD